MKVGVIGNAANRRTLLLFIGAMLLPTLIFAALQIGFSYRAEQQALEATTLAQADAIMAAIDGNLERSRASALALATATAIKRRDWPGADARAREIAALNPDWRTVRLIDVASSRELFDIARPFGPPRPVPRAAFAFVSDRTPRVSIGGMIRDPECICATLTLPIRRAGRLRYVLSILIDPSLTQKLLLERAPRDGTSAVVDRHALFIARTRDYARRVGTPATVYVRKAVRGGGGGTYSSITYEGLVSYTAYSTSTLSGWSTHIAVPSVLIDMPVWRSRLATGVAVLASLALAAALGWAVLRALAAQRAGDVRMQQAQRLEAVGKMTGGIAHDFNNMLAIVIGSLDLAQHRLKSGRTDIVRHIDNAMDGAKRAADLTRRLLAFSRRQPLAPVVTDLPALLDDMTGLLHQTLSESIDLGIRRDDDLWCVFIDPGQLENAIINMAANARDAMPDGGRLSLVVTNAPLDRGAAAALDLQPGDYVRLQVVDTGTGMSAETVKRAFEPFFTTKEVGRGTGLGLSQIYGFADQSGGRARIASAPGEGTTIELYLPRGHGAGPDRRGGGPVAAAPLPHGVPEEIILVVEDEAQVRRTSVDALRELGYSVRHAADGREALALLAGQSGVRLLFTDIVMPGMTGRELAREAQRRLPELRLLFATGYEREAKGDEGPEGDLLLKPFALDQLARKVRDILDAAPARAG